ncbi:MAG: lipid-A-disaccharide synthase [Deltaproteobacteria bacterium]|nr:lipid-A-disaccharide synthase [Deltaproteobacteria bacterium]
MARPRVLVVAGEASADRYAARMLRALDAEVASDAFGMGGAELEAAGMDLLADLRRTSAMGTTEVLPRLPRIVGAFATLCRAIAARPPDLAVLVDLPDFNLPLARRLAARRIPVLYYVGPQVWAWRAGRLREMARTVTRAALVFPFEPPLYAKAGIAAEFVGHPILDDPAPSRDEARRDLALEEGSRVVALLPGSRPAEIRHHLPALVGAARHLSHAFGRLVFLVPVAPSMSAPAVRSVIEDAPVDVRAAQIPARTVLAAADLALVATGTATLEAARSGTPSVFFHRASVATWAVGRTLVSVQHLSMPNILLGRRAIPELWQWELGPARLAHEAAAILGCPAAREQQRQAMADAVARLGSPGAAARVSAMAAELLS